MKNSTLVVKTILCLFVLFATGKLSAQSATAPFTHQGITASTGDFLGFLQYKPADYDQHPSTKYPLIIFLHGIGERGNGTTDLDKVAYVGLPRIIYKGNKMNFTWNGKTETFLVLAPQCPMKYGMWPSAFVNDLIAYAKKNLHIDEDRIYLTGLSMGGGGSMRYISDDKPDNAKNIAAMCTIAAPCTFRTGQYAAEAHLPIWSFHAEDDPTASVQCDKNAFAGLSQWNVSPKPMLDLWPTGGHIVWDRVYTDTNYQYQGVVNIYEWFLAQNKKFAVNKLPVANAGGDRTATGNSIVLDASASTDADGKLVRFVWKKLSGPACGTIAEPMSTNPSTTYRGITTTGKYTFELAAVDDRAAFTRDTVTINVTSIAAASPVPVKDTVKTTPVKDTIATTVKNPTTTTTPVKKDTIKTAAPVVTTPSQPAKATSTNKAPVANAGTDIVTTMGWPQSMINAYGSTDSDGWLTSAKWTKVSGPAQYKITDATAFKTYATNLTVGVYVFRVTVTDNKGASSSDDMTITVNAAPTPAPKATAPVTPAPSANKAPVANAGTDIVTNMGWPQSMINAYGSTDSDGWLTSAKWTKVSGPAQYKITDATAFKTYATNLTVGVYVFRVTVIDNKGASSYDDMTITVNATATATKTPVVTAPVVTAPVVSAPSSNKAPVANAGKDVATNMGWPQSMINSSLSKDTDGWITKVRWSKVSGPAQYKIDDTTALVTYAKNLTVGVYVFRVTVTDNKGAVSTDDVQISVAKTLADMKSATTVVSSAAMIEAPAATSVNEGIISLSPNPAINSLQLQYASAVTGSTNIFVYDMNGRAVKTIVASKTQTVLMQTVDIHDLTAGIYYAVAKTGTKSYAPVKFIKQ